MSRYLAIDADAGGLFVAAATVRSGGVQLEQALAVLDESASQLTAANAIHLGTKLKSLLKEAGIAPAPVLICFGRDRVIVKDVKFPPVAASEEAAVVRFQAQKDLADSPDDVVMDYFTTPGATGEVQRRATVVFVRKQLFAAAQEFCVAAGLKLAAVSARPFASLAGARRAISTGATQPPEDNHSPVAVLSLWGTGGEFAVGHGSQTLFSRTISPMSLGAESALLGEIKRSLASFNGQTPGRPVQALYLAEGDAGGASWIGRMQSGLGLPVHAIDPLAGSKVAESVPPELHGRFLGPVGLLATKTSGEALNINFQAPRAPRSAPNKNKRRLVWAGAIAAILLAAAGGFLYLQLIASEKEGMRLAQEKTELEDKAKGQSLENKRVDAAQKYVAREVPWIDIYYDLNDQFPTVDKLRLLDFNGTIIEPVPVKAGQPVKAPAPLPAGVAVKSGVKPGEKPIAKITLMILSEDATLPAKLNDTLNKESGFGNSRMTQGGLAGGGGAGSKVQQYTINAEIYPRKPEDFRRKLAPPPPPPKIEPPIPKPVDPEEFRDPFDFGGGQ